MEFKFLKRELPNISEDDKKLSKENIKGIVLHSNPEYFNKDEFESYKAFKERNKEVMNFGAHYMVDDEDNDIYTLIPIESQAISIEGKPTYISRSLFNEKPEEFVIAINMCVCENEKYVLTEQKLIRFVVSLLREYKLTAKDVWRAFDLSQECYGPFHMLNKDIFAKFIEQLEKFIPPTDDEGGEKEGIPEEEEEEKPKEEVDDDKIKITSPFFEVAAKAGVPIDEYVYRIYRDNIKDPKAYASKFQPWDKDREDAKNVDPLVGELQTRETPYNNLLQFKITENPPVGLDHCEKAVDELDAIETPQDVLVEPIYPDLITPPGDNIHIADGFSESKVQSSNNTPLTAEEFEKRQKTFDFSQFENMLKETKGRPVNPDDPFPVDDQIKKLEEHYPKVKVDKVTFNLKDTNHPNSEIGNAVAKNYAMCYDMVTEVAKRTEQRLVKLENNLATVMRNLFRVSSRININCVYYGGQSVYGKYKCIRCMHDDRINDGAIVTLDQCMNCTRYEPVLGQVYAILDETGSNIVQVLDDLQMSYMGLGEYRDLTSVSRYHEEPRNAKVDQHSPDKPLPFVEDQWKDNEKELEEKEIVSGTTEESSDDKTEATEDKADVPNEDVEESKPVNGFKMDWNPIVLESQKPHINEYDIENIKADKVAVKSDTQGIDRTMFVDSREKAVEYEKLEFDIKDYEFPDFGAADITSSGSNGHFGMGAIEVRQKIVDYALAAVKLCDEGKAWYWMDGTHRNCHDGNTCGAHPDGKQYWDCSSLTRDAYKSAGLGIIGQLTYDQFDKCKNSAGGVLIPLTDESQALPGDIVFFNSSVGKGLSTAELQNVSSSGVSHVGIYTGNGMVAHASSSKWGIKHTELTWDKNSFAFGRPKVLIELDNQAGSGVSGNWSREFHGISDELWNASAVADSNVNGLISNMDKYGYRDSLVKIAQEKGLDPYFVAAIISIETSGNPMCGGNYPGIMQSSSGYPSSTISGIEDNMRKGCDDIVNKAKWLKQKGWVEANGHVLATAHNCGQYGTTDALGHSHETRPSVAIPMMGKVVDMTSCKIPEVAQIIYDYTKQFQKSWNAEEKRTYATKVLRAYNIIYSKNLLGLPQQNNSNNSEPTPEGMPEIQKKQIGYNKSNRTQAIKYIVIHDTANAGGTAQNHFDYFNGGDRQSSADYFVDKNAVIEISNPDTYYTWQVGDGKGKNGITNQNAVGIEMCLESDSTVHQNTFNYTVNLTKHLMKKYNIPKSNVVRHFDASGKWCPERFRSNNWAKWEEFKSKI